MAPRKINQKTKEKSRLTKEEWREFTKTVWHIANTTHREHPAVFPEAIPHRLIKLFTFYGEAVLDPFAGTGVTAVAGIPLGRRVICIDQNPKYLKIIRQTCGALRNGRPNREMLQLVRGDSRKLDFLPDSSVQLVVTSPPYWNKADYGHSRANIGAIHNYLAFVDEVQTVFAECYRVLEPGRKICIVTANVNQHTEHGLLTFPLAADFAIRLRDVGFVLVNEIIWSKDRTGGRWGSWGSQRPIFGSYPYPPNFLFKNVHEYIIIAAKPPQTKTRGPKVKSYVELMRRKRS